MNKRIPFMLNAGDLLSRSKFPFVHKGVYLGNGLVLHNSPDRGEHVSDLQGFANGQPVSVAPLPPAKRPLVRQKMVATMRSPKAYDAVSNNCEHTITRITENCGYSVQLWVVGILLGLGLFTLAVTR